MPWWKLHLQRSADGPQAPPGVPQTGFAAPWWGGFIAVLGIAVSATLGFQAKEHVDRAVRANLELDSAQITDEIGDKLNACSDALHAGTALFTVREDVSAKDWQRFVAALKLGRNVCGNLGLGFTRITSPVSASPDDTTTAVSLLEPPATGPIRIIGLDMLLDPVRRAAMEVARDTGKVSISRKVQLHRDDPNVPVPAVVMYAPVYKAGVPVDTIARRRAAILGWVYSPHHIQDLMAPFTTRLGDASVSPLEMDIYDAEQESDGNLLYDSGGPNTPLAHTLFFHKRTVALNDSKWWLEFDRNPRSEPISYVLAWLYFAGGVLATVFVVVLLAAHRKASHLADIALRSEESVRQQNANLTTILEHLPGGVSLVDSDLKLVKVNQTFSKLMGLSESIPSASAASLPALIQRHIDQGHTHAQAHVDALQQMQSSERSTYDLECRFPDGKSIQVHGTALQGGGVVTFYADNTLRRAQELQLRKLSAAVDQSPHSIVITDIEGHIEYVNEAFVHMTGLSVEDVVGKNPRILGSGQTPAATFQHMWSALRQGLKWSGELTNKRKDGSLYIERASICAIRNPQGAITHYVSVQEDVTEQKNIEAELLQYRLKLEDLVHSRTAELVVERDRAESAVRAKSEFLSNMSHEIRTPIHAIMGFAMLCQQAELPTRAREQVRKITQASESLLGIINDILDASKLEAGMLEMERVEFDLGEVLARTSSLFQLKAAEKGLELVVACQPDVPEMLVGDGYRLGQVLTNLIGNAIKFTQTGEVVLKVKLVERLDGHVTLNFQVRDTGIGMTQEQAGRLFTAFSQADNSITRKYGGSGLGLAISQQLVAKMHGQVELESEPGQGTTFRFNAQFGVAQSAQTQSDRVNALIGKQVLVVEDNKLTRQLHTLNLSSYGCRVVSEESGEAALAAFERTPDFDFVILDLHLPGIDGLETAHRIRQAGHRPRTILVTADNLDVADASMAKGEIDAVLPKPVSRRVLREAMKGLVATGRIGQPAAGAGAGAGAGTTPHFAGRRILVVDDNEFNREIAVGYIKATGAIVDSADDGEAAVKAVGAGNYELVLMDIQMPVMDGYTAASILHKQFPDLVIVALTANAMADERGRVLAAGMQDILTKPFMPASLYATIGNWLPGGQQTLAQDVATESLQPEAAPVFDHATALLRSNSDPAILDRFLRMFMSRNYGAVDQLTAAVTQRKLEDARRHAHSIKSGAGMVGLTEMQLCAGELEANLLKGIKGADNAPECDVGLAQVVAAWARACAVIEPLLQANDSGVSG